jgi:hypothetical protein
LRLQEDKRSLRKCASNEVRDIARLSSRAVETVVSVRQSPIRVHNVAMLIVLVQSPAMLATTIIALGLLNYWMGLAALRAESRQGIFERTVAPTRGSRSAKAQMALPFVTAAPVAAVVLLLDHLSREALGGGYLVMQLAALIGNLEGLLRSHGLLLPGAAEGRVVLSAQYRYLSAAAQTVAFAVFAEIVAFLFKSLAFATGGALLLAASVGWYRRARQASESSGAIK